MRKQSFGESHFHTLRMFFDLMCPTGRMLFNLQEPTEFIRPGSADGEVQRQQQRQQVEGTTRRVRAEAKTSSFANLDTEASSFLNRFSPIEFCQSGFDNTERFMAGTRSKVARATSLPPKHVEPRVHETRTKPTATRPPEQPWRQRPSTSAREPSARANSRR